MILDPFIFAPEKRLQTTFNTTIEVSERFRRAIRELLSSSPMNTLIAAPKPRIRVKAGREVAT